MNNMKAVLGPNPWLWLWPQAMRGDGLSYPVNPDAGGESIADWDGVISANLGYQTTDWVPPLGGLNGNGVASGASLLQARLRGHLRSDDVGDMV